MIPILPLSTSSIDVMLTRDPAEGEEVYMGSDQSSSGVSGRQPDESVDNLTDAPVSRSRHALRNKRLSSEGRSNAAGLRSEAPPEKRRSISAAVKDENAAFSAVLSQAMNLPDTGIQPNPADRPSGSDSINSNPAETDVLTSGFVPTNHGAAISIPVFLADSQPAALHGVSGTAADEEVRTAAVQNEFSSESGRAADPTRAALTAGPPATRFSGSDSSLPLMALSGSRASDITNVDSSPFLSRPAAENREIAAAGIQAGFLSDRSSGQTIMAGGVESDHAIGNRDPFANAVLSHAFVPAVTTQIPADQTRPVSFLRPPVPVSASTATSANPTSLTFAGDISLIPVTDATSAALIGTTGLQSNISTVTATNAVSSVISPGSALVPEPDEPDTRELLTSTALLHGGHPSTPMKAAARNILSAVSQDLLAFQPNPDIRGDVVNVGIHDVRTLMSADFPVSASVHDVASHFSPGIHRSPQTENVLPQEHGRISQPVMTDMNLSAAFSSAAGAGVQGSDQAGAPVVIGDFVRQPLSSQVAQSVIQFVEHNRSPDGEALRVTLSPPDLGQLVIELSKSEEGISIRVTAREAVTLEMLVSRSQEIESQLRNNRLEFRTLEFISSDPSGRQSGTGGDQRSAHAFEQRNLTGPERFRGPSGRMTTEADDSGPEVASHHVLSFRA